MNNDKSSFMKKILIISSFSPYRSCNLVKDIVDGLKMVGCEVDFVGVDNYAIPEPGYYTIGKSFSSRNKSIFLRLKRKITAVQFIRKSIDYLRYRINKKKIGGKPAFLHLDDSKPETRIEEWESIFSDNIKYDLIITTFMRGDITSVTLKYLYEKYNAPLFIYAVDMQPMTGGCYYFYDCTGYKEQCRCCPVMKESEIPYNNYMLKKEVYAKYPIFACGNTYMKNFFIQSNLWNNYSYLNLPCIINEDTFRVKERYSAREYFGLSNDAFIIFAGAQNLFEERKGMKFLFSAVDKFKRSNKDVKIELVLAGDSYGNVVSIQDVRVVMIGYLTTEELVSMYSASNVFACTSWNDAGPSMVNQSIMCGTPVLSFDTGVAMDIVINGITGYKAKLRDTDDLAIGLERLYFDISHDSNYYREKCRNYGLLHFSRIEVAKQILQNLNKISRHS